MDPSKKDDTNSPPNKRRKLLDIPNTDEVIEEIFPQQTDALGRENMRRLLGRNVLLSGLGGLGVEVAKNLILWEAQTLTLHDHSDCTVLDLSSQYYLARGDLGRNRAEACRDRLSQLNPGVTTTSYSGELTEEFVKSFSVVVLTNNDLGEQLRISSVTHANNIPLIIASTKGVFGKIFCDFGESFVVSDPNGEACSTGYVANVTKDSEGVVTCFKTPRINLADGDFVNFSKVEGMEELNGCAPKQVTVINHFQFRIGDTVNYSSYVRGGIVKQVKMSRVFNMKPLAHALENPQFVVVDSGKQDRPEQLHLAFRTLHKFFQTHGRDPRPWNMEDAERFVNLSTSTSQDQGNVVINTELFDLFSKVCSGNVCPINSIIGGIVAQEVVKACSGKLTPINQWLYFDAIECIPKLRNIQEEDCQPIDNRYDSQVAVFGREFQNRLGNLNYFVIGAGTIGCELLKNLAMMGVGEINRGRLVVSDNELVKRSDLSNQFLYRVNDLQCSKSVVAANAIRAINLNTNVIANENKVCQETENVFDDAFFENIDGVLVQGKLNTRKYIGRKCVYHRKPHFDCGISGAKGSIQVFVPMLTQTFQCSQDPPEINFLERSQSHPNTTEDVLFWARNNFEILFNHSAENAQMFLVSNLIKEVDFGSELTIELLESVKNMLVDNKPNNFEDCLFWARKIWEHQYVDQIEKLILKFLPQMMTHSEDQLVSPPKSCPIALSFSIDNPLHLDYITAAANLLAMVFDINQNHNKEYIREYVQNTIERKFLELQTSNEPPSMTATSSRVSNRNRLSQLLFELPSREQLKGLKITPVDFDPDDDSNFHMDFVVAAANLRAANFGIEPADRLTGKLVVGNSTPVASSTASVVAGLAALELIKLTQGITDNDVSHLKNGFFNLALPFVDFAEPLPPTQYTYNDNSWTVWDRFEIDRELTLDQFLHHFQNLDLSVRMVYHGSCVLYSEYFPLSRLQEIRKLTMTQVLRKLSGKQISPNVRTLMFNLVCVDLYGKDVDVPHVRYVLPLSEVEQV